MRTLIVICLLALCGIATAQHYHVWQKISSSIVTNAYGQSVLQCQWQCLGSYGNSHYAVTLGHGTGYCPSP